MIEKKNFKKIEYHLYNYHAIRADMDEERKDILYASPSPPDGMPRSGNISDPTGSRAVKMASLKSETDRLWVECVDSLIDEYRQEGMSHYINLIRLLYFEKQSRIHILTNLCIERATFYNWRNTIVMDLSLKAASKNLVKF